MASAANEAHEPLNERLASIRNKTLNTDETIIAQAKVDHGQAVVVTSERILIIKAGITATGKIDGEIVGRFPFSDISTVKIRKGPLGAAIQILTNNQPAPKPDSVPDSIVVFTGPHQVKQCEQIAEKIEAALGKPLERIEAPSDKDAQTIIPETTTEREPISPRTDKSDTSESLPGTTEVVNQDSAPLEPQKLVQDVTQEQLESVLALNERDLPVSNKAQHRRQQPRSLAEEIYEELVESQSGAGSSYNAADDEKKQTRAESMNETTTEEVDSSQPAPINPSAESKPEKAQLEQRLEDKPCIASNPKLPRPIRRKAGKDKTLTLLLLLLASLFAGIAAIAPSRLASPTIETKSVQTPKSIPQNKNLLYKQALKVLEYKRTIFTQVTEATRFLYALETAITNGDKATIAHLSEQPKLEEVFNSIRAIETPPGLAGARDHIISGLTLARTCVARISVDLQVSQGKNLREELAELREARLKLHEGLTSIDIIWKEIERQTRKNVRSESSRNKAFVQAPNPDPPK
ncbi:MAG: hypothetical protein ACUVRS_03905 [Armatimonadota bacterium]